MAGVMGGARTSCSADTVDVLFEAAFFPPAAIAGRGRRYGLVTDAGQRFERGVDPAHQERAIERATALLLEIAGGSRGPGARRRRIEARLPRRARSGAAPRPHRTTARHRDRRQRREVDARVAGHAGARPTTTGWLVTPPSHRFDISIEAGSHRGAGAHRRVSKRSPRADAAGRAEGASAAEEAPVEAQALEILATRGYHEAITYAFVDPALQAKLFPGAVTPALSNPIASEMAVMRASLWPGLIKAALENQRRQQDRIRLFEHGARFEPGGVETDLLAGIAMGSRQPEQWGSRSARPWISST